MKRSINEANANCELLATRKTFPFAKKFCIKSIMSGGAMPHRLGLSESVLFFRHHRSVYENEAAFYGALKEIKHKALEKKIVVESATFEDAEKLMAFGADILQIEKASPLLLERIVAHKNLHHKEVKILATGGINKANVKDFAQTGVDGIVTSALYSCGMADLGSRIME
jgi:molybdenum transport protein